MSDNIEMQVRRMLQNIDHKIAKTNKRNIGEIVGEIREKDFLKLAEAISVCRAHYLKDVLQLVDGDDNSMLKQLSADALKHKVLYQGAMEGFGALRHALERGYFVLKTE